MCELKSYSLAGFSVTPQSHPHGCVSWNVYRRPTSTWQTVTPSRVCELKFKLNKHDFVLWCHTLTGVWVEIYQSVPGSCGLLSHPHGCVSWNWGADFALSSAPGHTLTGVWVEITHSRMYCHIFGHTLTGVWVEISEKDYRQICCWESHPHGCVSWNAISVNIIIRIFSSHPHGCVSWNLLALNILYDQCGHTLTGVWVEIHWLLCMI